MLAVSLELKEKFKEVHSEVQAALEPPPKPVRKRPLIYMWVSRLLLRPDPAQLVAPCICAIWPCYTVFKRGAAVPGLLQI